MMNSKELALTIANMLVDKKAEDVCIIRVDHLTSITDYFVIATGRNTIAVRALAEDVEDRLSEQGIEPRRKEGVNDARWIVVDYASVIVHVLHPEEREYYNIERLWLDGSNQVPLTEQ
ncbi:ribosome silencing factor [Eubacteriales bacterium OttesenSCG-928-N13]|nr:ribosome silencing factor [Eubacteriales bacterium OttesenSCG-928-N13]